jgi:methylaspartate mutase sigma subunit
MDNKELITLVTGVIGDDVHITGIRVLEHALNDAGFKVVSLGIQVSQEEFINAAIETKAAAILISSLSGHGKVLCEGLKDKCLESGLTGVSLYIGGMLAINEPWEETEKAYKKLGFDRVYPPSTMPDTAVTDLENDLVKRKHEDRDTKQKAG